MSRRLPPLNGLKVFEAAARHLSFTRAAEELFVTQAAVSHQIKGLEEFLGIKLFRRRNRVLLLTEEGQSYYLDIKDVFTGILESTERLLALTEKGVITVAVPTTFAVQWLVPRISRFSSEHPDIDVRITAVDYDENFLSEEIDVAVYYGKGRWSGVESSKLHTEYLTPVCSPNLLNGDIPLNQQSDLKHHNLLHDGSRQAWKSWVKVFGLKGVNVNQGPIFSHSMLVMQAAVLGQGIALAHSVLARPEIEAGRLVRLFQERKVSSSAYYVICDEAQAEQGKIKAFKDWILALVKEEQAHEYHI